MALNRKLLFFPALLLGVAVFFGLVKTRGGPVQDTLTERARAVRVLPAPRVSVVPRAVGYGNVQPGQVWEAVAEVGGKIVEIHKSLKRGAILPAGSVLLRIDPKEYRLALAQAESKVQNALAQMSELDQRERNARASLEVEQASGTLAAESLERKRKLLESGTISQSEYDLEEQKFLTQKNAVQNYASTLGLVPSERAALAADLASSRSQLDNARLNLEKTVIRAPFECRVSEVNVELAQYAISGHVLAIADSMGMSEIPAQVPIAAFRNLLDPMAGTPPLGGQVDMDEIRRFIGLEAVVRLNLSDGPVQWQARFSRLSETIDLQTRTLGVYVVVDESYLKARPGSRPPLVKNMYCEVELRGRPRPASVVVPRSAVRGGRVFVVGADNRLVIREIVSDYVHGNLVSVNAGLEEGEWIIVSDIEPAVQGMLLEPVLDEDALARLVADATGEALVR